MRLFLASQDFGEHASLLSGMAGDNRRALVVFNARDYKPERGVEKQKRLFAGIGLEFNELDLRNYFGKKEELQQFIAEFNPGVVDLLGGNSFLLRRAMAQSGLDEILKKDIKNDKYVLAGHSAGSVVVGPSLKGFERVDSQHMLMPGYDEAVIWDGLGLIDVRIVPHADSRDDIATIWRGLFEKEGLKYLALNDSDALVINDGKEEVLR